MENQKSEFDKISKAEWNKMSEAEKDKIYEAEFDKICPSGSFAQEQQELMDDIAYEQSELGNLVSLETDIKTYEKTTDDNGIVKEDNEKIDIVEQKIDIVEQMLSKDEAALNIYKENKLNGNFKINTPEKNINFEVNR